jgi:hypothetical protein|uniref:Uncharacterized 8.8 kDa protein in fixW 5'region n=2 Tax=Rhizobium leguminosarum TaxID=384 RepID=YFX2_RHILE|nr:RecName: Full=Uncharacterized 8.8 kDa protein in fixW 5'region [Rhizobium leguminosarum]CAA34526.1 unnamed protein product [Rhizobium leguminosarum]CAD24016.1 YFX2 protein [Rhizobium leguminosarum bv. viciae]
MASCCICIRPRHLPVTTVTIVTLSEERIRNVTHPQKPFQKTRSPAFVVQPMERAPLFEIGATRADTWPEGLIPRARSGP